MVIDRDLGLRKLIEQLAGLSDAPSVVVGVTGSAGSELVVIAASNEFGTADGHIPERSFLRSTVDDHENEILDDLQAATEAVLDGRSTTDREFGRVGEKWVGVVKERIAAGIEPENAPSTARAKGGPDATPDDVTPLIDQGRLRNSITHELRRE